MGEVLYTIVVYSEIYGVISYCICAIFENRMIHTQRNQYLGCKTLKGFGGFKVFGQQTIRNIGYQKQMLLHTGMGKSQHGWFQIQFIWFEGRLTRSRKAIGFFYTAGKKHVNHLNFPRLVVWNIFYFPQELG